MATPHLTFSHLTWESDDGMNVGGLQFDMSTTAYTQKTNDRQVVLLKNKAMIEFYRSLLDGKPVRNVLEFGTWEGGFPLFLMAATNLQRFVGIDLRPAVAPVQRHAEPFGDRLKLFYDTSQSDVKVVGKIIDENFDGELDLVIDDASHNYAPTKAAFEIAFPRLKVGGIYVIEDWSWAHYADRHYDELWNDQPALTNLGLEIMMAIGSRSPIESMEVTDWCLVIRKRATVERNFRLDDWIRLGPSRAFTRI